MPIYLLDDEDIHFPPATEANEEGLLAIGGDLSTERLLEAYKNGIFPWYDENDPILWWSPSPRMVIFPKEFNASKSLTKTIKSGTFEVRIDTCFEKVISLCAKAERKDQEGTWISPQIIEAYTHLHTLGYAHSFETFFNNELVGGLYGISLGKVFFGESMFHLARDASKVAFYHLIQFLNKYNFTLLDAQQDTDHLRSLGGSLLCQKDFLHLLNKALQHDSFIGKWRL